MRYKKIITISAILGLVALLSAFIPQQGDQKAKNLKVLPKNISHDELKNIMDDFKVALGVKCNFCHAARKDDPSKLDFASDENEHKEIARKMMRMTAKINKSYFNKKQEDGSLKAISCATCHNGAKHPKMI